MYRGNLCSNFKSKIKINFNKDFFCGYSPERVNPGDKKRNLNKISKIISGSNKETLINIYKIYSKSIQKQNCKS